MLGAGSMVSQGGRSLIRLATTGMMLSGLGVAGLGVYGNQIQDPRVNTAQAFIQEHAREAILLGVVLLVVGGVLNFVMMRRMQKRMMSSLMGGMPALGGAGGMAGMQGMPGLMGMPPGMGGLAGMPGASGMAIEIVKVRCAACGKLQLEAARFCADCGRAMTPVPAT